MPGCVHYIAMMQYDTLYSDRDADHDKTTPDIVGPLQRADETEFRKIEYCPTFQLAAGAAAMIFTTNYNLKPDFWKLFIIGIQSSGPFVGFSLQEEGGDLLPFVLSEGSTQALVLQPQRITLPGNNRKITLVNGPQNQIDFILAAIWGYDPKDIF